MTPEHYHDLGKLMFAFSVFWAYIWFSQYMLIWYANIPEETGYFLARAVGAWSPLLLLNLALNWAAPFVLLLPVRAKRDATILLKTCWVILAGRAVDLYVMILPSFGEATVPSLLWGAAATAVAAGAFQFLFRAEFGKAAPLTTDPRVSEALSYHN